MPPKPPRRYLHIFPEHLAEIIAFRKSAGFADLLQTHVGGVQQFNSLLDVYKRQELVEDVRRIMESMGIDPISVPIRGGTDGSRLSYMGILCPNLCAGGANAHGRFEYVPIQSMDTIVELLKKIVAA